MKKENIWGFVILGGFVLLFLILISVIQEQEQEHIERVSARCAMENKGIVQSYTSTGEKYYICAE